MSLKYAVAVKGKVVPDSIVKAYRGNRRTDPNIFSLGARRRAEEKSIISRRTPLEAV